MTEVFQIIPGQVEQSAGRGGLFRGRRVAASAGAVLLTTWLAACGGGNSGNNAGNASPTDTSSSATETCPEDPDKATMDDVDAENPQLIFSWLCGGSDTIFVYHGPNDTDADREVVGQYYGVESQPGKNVAPAKCYKTNGRPVPSHPEAGELQRPEEIQAHWIELETGAWAAVTYSFNGQLLERVLDKCDPSELPPD